MKKLFIILSSIVLLISHLSGCNNTLCDSLEETLDEQIKHQNNVNNPQVEFYNRFKLEVENNEYDKWLDRTIANGKLPEKELYAEYLKLWEEELAFTINNASSLFNNEDDFLAWENELLLWLKTTKAICNKELLQMNSQLAQLEIIIKYCNIVKQKVIDTKYFCYILENPNIDDPNPISLKWKSAYK